MGVEDVEEDVWVRADTAFRSGCDAGSGCSPRFACRKSESTVKIVEPGIGGEAAVVAEF